LSGINLLVPLHWELENTSARAHEHDLGKHKNTLESCIFANVKILVGIVRWNAIDDQSHSYRDLVRAKPNRPSHAPVAGKKTVIGLTSFYDLHEDLSTHSVSPMENIFGVDRYLAEVITHENDVPKFLEFFLW
jgi:hypothetical protein